MLAMMRKPYAALALVALSCSESGNHGVPSVGTAAGTDAPALIAELRARFDLSSDASVESFVREGAQLEPRLAAGALRGTARRATVALPTTATGAFVVRDDASGIEMAVTLVDAHESAAEVTDGYVVYRGAHASGDLVHRATAEGTEDYLLFETVPSAPVIAYDVALGTEVAGLRLVANTLELLDRRGVPRLRMAPPYLIDDDGERHGAEVAVRGCELDTNPAAPWGRTPVAPQASACEVRIRWDGDAVAYPAWLDPTWTTTGSMVVARQRHTATVLASGNVLVVAGDGTGNKAELFDPVSETWSATASTGGSYTGATASLLADGRVLVVGFSSSARLYDPIAGTWTLTTNQPSFPGRTQHTATVLADGRVLIAGGGAGITFEYLEHLAYFNPATNTWTNGPSGMGPRNRHSATLLADGRVLIAGGRVGPSSSGTDTAATSIVNPVSSSAGPGLNMPEARSFHRAVLLSDGRVLVAGGRTGTATAALFDPSTGAWSTTGSLALGRCSHTLESLGNGSALLIGGATTCSATDFSSSVEIYDGASGTWSAAANLLGQRGLHTTSTLLDGRLLVAGGSEGGSSATATAELANPGGCVSGAECASGFCVDGWCCDNACGGGAFDDCVACDLPGVEGTCAPVASGSVCGDPSDTICTEPDTCDGNGACIDHGLAASGAPCGDPTADACTAADTCDAAGSCVPNDIAPCDDGITEDAKFIVSSAGAFLGASVAIQGADAIAGAYNEFDDGRAHRYHREAGGWASVGGYSSDGGDAAVYERFGEAVAIANDTVLIGAPMDEPSSGSAAGSVLVKQLGVPGEVKLRVPSSEDGGRFGTGVSLAGDTAIVGAPYSNEGAPDSGSAFVFVRSSAVWTLQSKLVPSDPAPHVHFGSAMSMQGDTALIGAYVFEGAGGVWSEHTKLTTTDGEPVGDAVALDGDTAVLGKYSPGPGSVYVFVRSGGVWTQQAKLMPSDGTPLDWFGCSVSLSGERLLVGALYANSSATDSGAAYLFERFGTSWAEKAKLVASDAASADLFGHSVALSSDTAMIGAPGDDDSGANTGAVYFFSLPPAAGCSVDGDCPTGHCADGECCDSACGGSVATDCQACNLPGLEGICSPLAATSPCGDGTDGECTDPDTCDPAGTCLSNDAVPGTACGDSSDDACDHADACDSGACVPNYEAAGAPCGDQGVVCHMDDSCDGSGACVDQGLAASGSACGDSTDDACTDPDTCDATGACSPNHASAASPCGDQRVACHLDDMCDGLGSCTDNGFDPDGTSCDDGEGHCNAIGTCLPDPPPAGGAGGEGGSSGMGGSGGSGGSDSGGSGSGAAAGSGATGGSMGSAGSAPPPDDPGPGDGGCAIARTTGPRGAPWWPALALGIAMARRRRRG
jgi:hypothetical protein